MSESFGGERSQEDEFIERLGLADEDDIRRARELAAAYRAAILEVNTSGIELITPDLRFTEDLHADSLEILEVLEILQEKVDIDLPTEAFEEATTAGAAFEIFYGLASKNPEDPDDNTSGDREPRNPVPSAPSGSVHKDLTD